MILLRINFPISEPACVTSTQPVVFTNEEEIKSPQHPKNYPNNAFCMYTIRAPTDKVMHNSVQNNSVHETCTV